MRLYELAQEFAYWQDQMESAQTDEDYENAANAFFEADCDMSVKGDNFAKFIRNKEAEVAAYDAEIKRMQAKKKARENEIRRAKEYLQYTLESIGATELKTSIGRFYLQKNPPSVTVLDLAHIPERFLIAQPPKVDAKAMLAEFRLTRELFDGVVIEQKSGLRFR